MKNILKIVLSLLLLTACQPDTTIQLNTEKLGEWQLADTSRTNGGNIVISPNRFDWAADEKVYSLFKVVREEPDLVVSVQEEVFPGKPPFTPTLICNTLPKASMTKTANIYILGIVMIGTARNSIKTSMPPLSGNTFQKIVNPATLILQLPTNGCPAGPMKYTSVRTSLN